MKKFFAFGFLVAAVTAAAVLASSAGFERGLRPDPPALEFGKILVGNEARREVSWINGGKATLEVASGRTQGADFAFDAASFHAGIVAPGGQKRSLFLFAPREKKTFAGAGEILHASGKPGRTAVRLSGEGIYSVDLGALSVRTESSREFLDFGEVPLGQTRSLKVFVKNSSSEDLEVVGVWSRLEGVYSLGSGNAKVLIPKGAEAPFDVTFMPARNGEALDALLVLAVGRNGDMAGLSVMGKGVRPEGPAGN